MARFLALDAETGRFCLMAASVKGSSTKLESAVAWDEGEPLTLANAKSAGESLRAKLKEAGISSAPLLAAVGRDRLVIKEIRIPSVPPHEEPAIVKFQAMKELSDVAGESILDYMPAPNSTDSDRRVLVVSVRKEILSAYRELAQSAGLKFAALTIRPTATLAGLNQVIDSGQVEAPTPRDAAVALLVRGDKWAEFSIITGDQAIQSRSLAGPAVSSDAAILSDVKRNLAVYANQPGSRPVKAVYLAEPDSPGGLRDTLESSIGLPVKAFDPVIGIARPEGPAGAFAGLAGLFALQGMKTALPINFLQPRQPKPPATPNKGLYYAAAVAAIGLLLVGAVYIGLKYVSRTQELKRLTALQRDLKADIQRLEPESRQIKAMDDWVATDVNWLDELYDMTDRVPNPDKVRITQFFTKPLDVAPNSKSKYVAAIDLKGVTTADPVTLDKFMIELSRESAYRVPGKSMRSLRGPPSGFIQEYTLSISLEKRPTDKYSRSFTATPPPKKGRSRDGGGNVGYGFPGFAPGGGFAP